MRITAPFAAGRDELRLAAVLFALRLNAAGVAVTDPAPSSVHAPADDGLRVYHLGRVATHFCESPDKKLLLILFAHVAAGLESSTRLAADLLDRFQQCFHEPLAQAAAAGTLPARSALKRQAFAAELRGAVSALPGWIMARMLEEADDVGGTTASSAALPRPRACDAAAVHSAALCEALHPRTPEAYVSEVQTPRNAQTPPPRASIARETAVGGGGGSGRLLGLMSSRRHGGGGSTPPRTQSHAETVPPLSEVLRLPPPEDRSGRPQSARPHSARALRTALGRLLTSPRTAPRPPPPPQPPSDQLLCWCDAVGSLPAGASASNGASNSAGDGAGDGATAAARLWPIASTGSAAHWQQLVTDLHSAWRHRALRAGTVLYSAPSEPIATVSATEGRRSEVLIVLLRSPILLRVRAALPAAERERHSVAAEPQIPAMAAALLASLQPWLPTLALSLRLQASIATGSGSATERPRLKMESAN